MPPVIPSSSPRPVVRSQPLLSSVRHKPTPLPRTLHRRHRNVICGAAEFIKRSKNRHGPVKPSLHTSLRAAGRSPRQLLNEWKRKT
ncbi:hypothetical protein HMPREF9440_00309 [Sutterella parvirubra YIT 11816]|uniref:Uncharacterized protein n=1 Tax=Sutterella parvirubra YIT 11816 TaxID=762967 RepID=H3KC59_9BURK|nr:hypothetical protein HMPREF9440_00309 [Sutterella parvirubra YIT 11816]